MLSFKSVPNSLLEMRERAVGGAVKEKEAEGWKEKERQAEKGREGLHILLSIYSSTSILN